MNINLWPYFDEETIEEVSKILRSGKVNYWTGSKCKEFEEKFSIKFQQKFSIALMNGSVALTSAYKSLDLNSNDEVITTPRTFLATTSAMQILGVKPVFVDVCRDSGCITPENIEKAITKKTKAISVVHLGGWPADMLSICSLAKKYNLKVIEDCSQSHGAKIGTKHVGSFGDIATWSFCQDKIMTTGGEGGMVSTESYELMDKIWSYKDHGKTINSVFKVDHKPGFRWVHERLGTNLRMTEMQAAIGIIQIEKLDSWISKRKKNAMILYDYLKDISCIRIPLPNEDKTHAWYKFYVYLKISYLKTEWNRDRIIERLSKYNLPSYYGSCSEIYLEKGIKNYKIAGENERLPISEELGNTSLMFLVNPNITDDQINFYGEKIRETLLKASK